jgi:hypothetical protein
MIEAVTVEDLEQAVREIALEDPDYVYDRPYGGCVYFDKDGCPSCLIGHGLAKLGITPERVGGYNNSGVGGLSYEDIIVGEDIKWLMDVQDQQDAGEFWGNAVRFADLKKEQRNANA